MKRPRQSKSQGNLRVLRISSVFEAPDGALNSKARRFDPVGGMQGHTARLSRGLDELGPSQEVIDVFAASAAAKVEHYEILSYQGLIQLATQLGIEEKLKPGF